MYDALAPNVKILISPIDPGAQFRSTYGMNESYAGLLNRGQGDISSQREAGPAGFTATDWANQTALREVSGALEWVRFAPEGRLFRGIGAARESKPDRELCGLCIALRTVRFWNRLELEKDVERAPFTPEGVKVLMWKARQGSDWETVLPTTPDAVSMVRHREAPKNKSLKAVTEEPLKKDQGFEMTLDFDGKAHGHVGDPGVRVTWGNSFSIVFRGAGAKAFPQIETREGGKWKVRMVLREGTSMTDQFWLATHKLQIYRLGGKLIVELDGVGYHLALFGGGQVGSQPNRASWPKAPVEVSINGADVQFSLALLSGNEDNNQNRIAQFERFVMAQPRIDGGYSFEVKGARPRMFNGTTSQMVGDMLERVEIKGNYAPSGAIVYRALLRCDEFSSPLLSSLSTLFPASASVPPPPDVDVRLAVSQWEVDSSDPEDAQAAQASFSISRELLKKVCAQYEPPLNWWEVLAPFRPVTISIQQSAASAEEVLFRGWIKPNNYEVSGSVDQIFSVVCGDAISERLNEHSALIDERFVPLELMLNPSRGALWGAEGVQYIIRTVMGNEAADRFNGGRGPLYYYASSQPALYDLRAGKGSLSLLLDVPAKGGLYYPPPFGTSALSWIDKLAGHDFAVIFHDPQLDALCYGDIREFYAERGTDANKNVATGATITQLSNQGEFERAYNDIRVWGHAPSGAAESLMPSLLMGRAGDNSLTSTAPTSRAQSWMRTLLIKPDMVSDQYLSPGSMQELAYVAWLEWEGSVPEKFSLEFNTGLMGARWGEMIEFAAPQEATPSLRRITKVTHRGNLSGDSQERFTTKIEARSLSNSGQ